MNFPCDLLAKLLFHRTAKCSTDFSLVILSNQSSSQVKSLTFSKVFVICFFVIVSLSFGGLTRCFLILSTHLHQRASINIEKSRNHKLAAGVDLLDKYLTEVLRNDPDHMDFSKVEISPYQEIATASIFPYEKSAFVDFKILIKHFEKVSITNSLLTENSNNNSINRKLQFRCPVYGSISSFFGMRTDPVFEGTERHNGIDIANALWSPVVGTANGRVVFAGWNEWFGNEIIIEHGNTGYQTIYAHLQKIVITTGDSIKGGQLIGYLGSTGKSTGPHLHYEIHFNGKAVDPVPFLSAATITTD